MNLPRIRLMISSRSLSSAFSPSVSLEVLRLKLQKTLQDLRWTSFDQEGAPLSTEQPIFDVWIHENEPGIGADRTTFELSLKEIGRSDIIIVLSTGEAGSAVDETDLGICHAELQMAVSRRGDVVFVIKLPNAECAYSDRDLKFQKYVDSLPTKSVNDEADLSKAVLNLLHQSAARLVRRGASAGRRRDRGQALDWIRLDLAQRRKAMRSSLALELHVDPSIATASEAIRLNLAGRQICIRLDAIPDALGVAAARELVGQPFLRDHLLVNQTSVDAPGVVHLIACYRGVTESQASKMLGTPDAITIASDFGIYAADHVQQIQLFFLAQCADEGAVAIALRRLNEWLKQTGEIERVIARAKGRRGILRAVQEALESTQPSSKPASKKRAGTKKRTPRAPVRIEKASTSGRPRGSLKSLPTFLK